MRVIAHIVLLAGVMATAGIHIALAGDTALPRTAGRWNRIDTVGVFNDQQLFDLIDGGASLFLEYGFVRAYAAEYGDSAQRFLSVELYEMSDPTAAFGVFSSLSAGIGKEVQPGLRMSPGEGFGFFWKGTCMGSMTLLEGPPAAPGEFVAVAICIGNLLQGSGPPPALVRRLLHAGCDADGMVLFNGRLGLLNHSPFRAVQNVPVETGVTGSKSGSPFMVLSYADSVRSHSAYRQWVKELVADGSTVLQQTEQQAHVRIRDGETLTISCIASHIVGVSGTNAVDIIHAIMQE